MRRCALAATDGPLLLPPPLLPILPHPTAREAEAEARHADVDALAERITQAARRDAAAALADEADALMCGAGARQWRKGRGNLV